MHEPSPTSSSFSAVLASNNGDFSSVVILCQVIHGQLEYAFRLAGFRCTFGSCSGSYSVSTGRLGGSTLQIVLP